MMRIMKATAKHFHVDLMVQKPRLTKEKSAPAEKAHDSQA
jgi:hypothetical protein